MILSYINFIAFLGFLFWVVPQGWNDFYIRTGLIVPGIVFGMLFTYVNLRAFAKKYADREATIGSKYMMREIVPYLVCNGFFSLMSAFSIAILFSLLFEDDVPSIIDAGVVSFYFILNSVFTKMLWIDLSND